MAALAACAAAAHATPFSYTDSFIGSGKIGSTSYKNLAVAIKLFADTSNVENDGDGFYENDSSAVTVTIGGTSYVLTNVDDASSNQQDGADSVAGIALFGTSILEVGTASASFAAYDLSTAIGPVSGKRSGYVNTGGSFTTTSGSRISFSSVGDTTFTAAPTASTASPVPEPTSLLLVGTAALLGVSCCGEVVPSPRKSSPMPLSEEAGRAEGC